MIAANHFAAQWADVLWRATWQGGLVIAVIALLCLACRRIPAQTRAWLWWLAGIQLLVRLVIAIPIVVQLPASSASLATEQTTMADSAAATPVLAPPVLIDRAPIPPRPDWPLLLISVWAAGGLVVFGAGTRRLLRARALVVNARPVTDPLAVGALEVYWGIGSGLPRLLESDQAPCPLLVGWLTPAIILPSNYAEKHSGTEVRMAIAHEVTHVRRRHYLFGLGNYLTQLAFYYHPLAWLAAREAALAREEVCDLEVLRLTGQSPSSYARLLLKSAQSGAPVAALGVAFGYRDLRRRINMLRSPSQDRPAVNRRGWATLVVLIALASLPWQIVAQTKHSPTVPVAAKKAHVRHVTRRQSPVTTVTYEQINGKVIRTTNRAVRTVVRLKDVPRGAVIAQYSPGGDFIGYYVGPNLVKQGRFRPGQLKYYTAAAPGEPVVVKYYQSLSGAEPPVPPTPTVPRALGGATLPTIALPVPPPPAGGVRYGVVAPPMPPQAPGFRVTATAANGVTSYTMTSSASNARYTATGSQAAGNSAVSRSSVKVSDDRPALGVIAPLPTASYLSVKATDVPSRTVYLGATAQSAQVRAPGYSLQAAAPGSPNQIVLADPNEQSHSMSTKIKVNFEGIYADAALLRLLKLAGGDYMFRAEIPARRLTCKLTNVTVEKALRSILDSLDLHLRVADGTTYIER